MTTARGKDNETTRDKGMTGRQQDDHDHDDHDHDDGDQHNSTPTTAASSCLRGGLRGLNDRAGGRKQRGDEDGDDPLGILNPGKTRKNIHTGFFGAL